MEVTRCFFDRGREFGLLAHAEGGERSTVICLGDQFQVVDTDGTRPMSTRQAEHAAWLLGLLGETISGVRASTASRLVVAFSSGLTLQVDSHPVCEAWQIDGPTPLLAFAGIAGDGPGIFDARSRRGTFEAP
jgi:hypothetical protein